MNSSKPGGMVHNVRSLFVAGLAQGLERPLCILVSKGHAVPADIVSLVAEYSRPEDVAEIVADFSVRVTEFLQGEDSHRALPTSSLSMVNVGDPTAENEMMTLGDYFLTTEQYSRTLRGEVNLVVGRKGAGKTALFLQIRDALRRDRRNVVLDLKPEGYQLSKLKEDVLTYIGTGSSQHLVTAIWEYVILREIANKLLKNDASTYRFNHEVRDIYVKLEAMYRQEKGAAEGDFSERLMTLTNRISNDYRAHSSTPFSDRLTAEAVTQLIYERDVRELREGLKAYLRHKEGVWVLFDNLDKGWSTSGVDATDTLILRSLIDAGRKVERDLSKEGTRVRCVVFIRNDVYELLVQNTADYGKEMRVTLDWTDPDLMGQMMNLRLIRALEEAPESGFQELWQRISVSHIKGNESFQFLLERSLMRPRNVLKLFSHAKGFAANLSHRRIEETDFLKGIKAYSQDLLVELEHELCDVFPQAKDLLYLFADSTPTLNGKQLHDFLSLVADEKDIERLRDFLLYYGVLGIEVNGAAQYIYDVSYDLRLLKVRAERDGFRTTYIVNAAFRSALSIEDQY
jgi:energy-coupling factor transporter ATP-binding protein EcfA2